MIAKITCLVWVLPLVLLVGCGGEARKASAQQTVAPVIPEGHRHPYELSGWDKTVEEDVMGLDMPVIHGRVYVRQKGKVPPSPSYDGFVFCLDVEAVDYEYWQRLLLGGKHRYYILNSRYQRRPKFATNRRRSDPFLLGQIETRFERDVADKEVEVRYLEIIVRDIRCIRLGDYYRSKDDDRTGPQPKLVTTEDVLLTDSIGQLQYLTDELRREAARRTRERRARASRW